MRSFRKSVLRRTIPVNRYRLYFGFGSRMRYGKRLDRLGRPYTLTQETNNDVDDGRPYRGTKRTLWILLFLALSNGLIGCVNVYLWLLLSMLLSPVYVGFAIALAVYAISETAAAQKKSGNLKKGKKAIIPVTAITLLLIVAIVTALVLISIASTNLRFN